MIRVLLVDDQSIVRRGLKALLKLDPALTVVGEAENGQQALEQVAVLHPDIVLMDVRMPEMDGIAATELICGQFPQTKVLVLTTFDDDTYVTQTIQAGAAGYLLKDTPLEELSQAIQLAHKGYTQLSPGLAQKILVQSQSQSQSSPEPPPGWQELTPREIEIVQRVAQGLSNREIAQTLFISEKTVKNHLTAILGGLNVRDRTQLALLATKHLDNK
jgi:DNA-binding NarL/FixJ family response regulator